MGLCYRLFILIRRRQTNHFEILFGLSLIDRLFEEAPEAQDLFYNFKDLKNQDELIQSLKELDHIARVMSAFGNCIELLDDMEQFANTVQGLGKAHIKIGINKSHIDVRIQNCYST